MSIFKIFANLVVNAYYEQYMHDAEANRERAAKLRKAEETKRQIIMERLEIEEAAHNAYRKALYEDPTSVMICPFGWSPFGFYL